MDTVNKNRYRSSSAETKLGVAALVRPSFSHIPVSDAFFQAVRICFRWRSCAVWCKATGPPWANNAFEFSQAVLDDGCNSRGLTGGDSFQRCAWSVTVC